LYIPGRDTLGPWLGQALMDCCGVGTGQLNLPLSGDCCTCWSEI